MNAWSMYPNQNGGRIVYSYPILSGNSNTWCRGNADNTGTPGSYTYGGADPVGIESGDLWPYVNTLAPYRCPSDNRLATGASYPYKNQVILRSYSINGFMAGLTFGTGSDTSVLTPTSWESGNFQFFTKENQLSKPAKLFVFIEEDGASINDSMFFMSMGVSASKKFYDLPMRHHSNCYPLTFADGHAETYRLQDAASLNWSVANETTGLSDWAALTNVTTVPK